MSFQIEPAEAGWLIRFPGGPLCCRAIEPNSSSQDLGPGAWLVLFVPVWSTPDREAIEQALRVAKHSNGRIHLAVGVFDLHNELLAWHPGIRTRWESPVWLRLQDGVLLDERAGMMSDEELTRFAHPG